MDSDSEWEAFWIWHAREAGRSIFIRSEGETVPLRPEDRGTPKDPSFGEHERRYNEAKATDPEGVASFERRSKELLEQGRKKRVKQAAIGFGPGSVRRRAFVDKSSDLHPYECDGPGKCVHCDQRPTYDHDPNKCALCDDSAA